MNTDNVDFGALGAIAKAVGFLVSLGATIYLSWVTKPDQVPCDATDFKQASKISIVCTTSFLVLAWGFLGNSNGLPYLLWWTIICVLGCVVSFLVNVFLTSQNRIKRQKVDPSVPPQPSFVTAYLATYVLYTAFGSSGLTAVAIFATVIFGNPANAATIGGGVREPSEYEVVVRISGVRQVQNDTVVPFRTSSGQVNVGCGSAAEARAAWVVPAGAAVQGTPGATWVNVENAAATNAKVRQEPGLVIAEGGIRGLDFQEMVFGIRNCPGGGHGEIVLSGQYIAHEILNSKVEDKVHGILLTARKGPLVLTLPSKQEVNLTRVLVEIRLKGQSDLTATIDIPLGQGKLPATGTSAKGEFRALVREGALEVEKV